MALMLDPKVLLGMLALLPLLDSALDTLILFAQKWDVYIGDFFAALRCCKGELFTYYLDVDTERNFMPLISCLSAAMNNSF